MKALIVLSLILEFLLIAYFFVPKSVYAPEPDSILVSQDHPNQVHGASPKRSEVLNRMRLVLIDCMMFLFLACNSMAMVIFWRRLQYDRLETEREERKFDSFLKKNEVNSSPDEE